ncbi:MAG: helix-turn-helix domain-containing protein [Bdellovibrionota bacterium]
MNEIFTIEELEIKLGDSLKALRLQKNMSRQSLCALAGVSLNALKHLELGEGATLKTMIRVVRALGRQEWLAGIAPKITINPLHMKRDHQQRQRARAKKKNIDDEIDIFPTKKTESK